MDNLILFWEATLFFSLCGGMWLRLQNWGRAWDNYGTGLSICAFILLLIVILIDFTQ